MTQMPSPSSIPAELAGLNQWVVWRYEEREGKRTKVPYTISGGMASVTEPATWSALEQVLHPKRKIDGIGIVVSADDPYCGIDLDHCIEAGGLQVWAREIVEQIGSYTEITPSGTGVRILLQGTLPGRGRKRGDIEVYCKERYFTITGNHLPNTPTTIEARQSELIAFLAQFFPDKEKQPAPARDPLYCITVTDEQILQAACLASNGGEFTELWNGGLAGHAGPSEANASLIQKLAFYTKDPAQLDRLFRQSGQMREKWDAKRGQSTWGAREIDYALSVIIEQWTLPGIAIPGGRQHREEKSETANPIPLPEIRVSNRQLRDLTGDCLRALVHRNMPAEIFVRAGALARVRSDEMGRPIIEAMDESHVRCSMTLAANYIKFSPPKRARKDEEPEPSVPISVDPPLSAVRNIMALGIWRDIPALDCIIETPALRPDGTILSLPGYDAQTSIYYYPDPALRVPDVPDQPTAGQVEASEQLINEVLFDFPFTDNASRDNALGLLLTPIVRPAINGPVPLALLDAPMSGTGKSLLAEAITLITTGKAAAMMSHPTDDEEMRKKITSILEQGSTMVVIDNVATVIESAALALALTSRIWKDRLLGGNKSITVSQRATWVATGNNIRLGGDIPRRCYWIRMDAQTSRPEQRDGFRHPDLLDWIRETRGDLLAALLIIARSWYASGCPLHYKRYMGSFENWERTVGSILHHCGHDHFLGNWEEMHSTADVQHTQQESFLRAIYLLHGNEFLRCGALAVEINKGGDLQDTLPMELAEYIGMKSFPIRIGNFLGNLVDNRFGADGLHVRAIKDSHAKTSCYKIVIG